MTQLAKTNSFSAKSSLMILASLSAILYVISTAHIIWQSEHVRASIEEIKHTAKGGSNYLQEIKTANDNLSIYQAIICIIGIGVIFILVRLVLSTFHDPIKKLTYNINQLAEGNLDTEEIKAVSHEMNNVIDSLKQLTLGSKKTTEFVREMGKGDFNTHFVPLSDKDELGNTLLEMRKNLLRVSEDEKKRNWVNEGLAKFGELLRMDTNNIHKFSENIITDLVRYLGANQGFFYVLNEDSTEGDYLELTACYAWDRKKHIENKIKPGQGLTGQVILEKETIFLTDVPNNYASITSGLGQANPRCVIILPLKYNDEVFGVIEMASFQIFEAYQQEFLNKLCVSIASSISSVRINVRTQKLLDDSIIQSKELQEKDGVMRQNLEEMRATQEEMERKSIQMQHMEIKTTAILEGCVDSIIAFNQVGTIEFYNKAAQDVWGIKREDAIGLHISKLLPIEIIETKEGCGTFHTESGKQKELLSKTELTINNMHEEELTILCSISKTMIGDKCFFTAFIQNISVDIF